MEHAASAAERMRATAARQQQLAICEVLAGQLDDLVPLDQLLDPQPQDFPKPPQGSERWVRDRQDLPSKLEVTRAMCVLQYKA